MRGKKILLVALIFWGSIFLFGSKKVFADEIYQIPEIANLPVKQEQNMLALPNSLITIINYSQPNDQKTVADLLNAANPGKTAEELSHISASAKQCFDYAKSLGYQVKWTDGVPDLNIIKEELMNKRPLLAYLTCDGNYWFEQNSAVMILGYQSMTIPGVDGKNTEFISLLVKSLDHQLMFDLYWPNVSKVNILQMDSQHDDSAKVNYTWSGTMYNFQK